MAAPLVIVIVVAAGGAGEASTQAMAATTRSALGGDAVVLVEDAPDAALLSDAEASALGERLHADAVVVVQWRSPDRSLAHVHLRGRGADWSDSDVPFGPNDAPSERGRALGYGVASMVRRVEAERPPEAAPAPRAVPATPPLPVPAPVPRTWLDAGLQGSVGVAGSALGLGGQIGLRWFTSDAFALHAATGFRGGTSLARGVSATNAYLGAGGAYRLSTPGPLSLGGRLLAVVTWQRAWTSVDAQSRWLPGVQGVLEGAVRLNGASELVLGAGAEVAFGATHVFVDDAAVGALPAVRLLSDLSLRIPL